MPFIFLIVLSITTAALCVARDAVARSERASVQLRATVPVICRITPGSPALHEDGNGADIPLDSFCNARVSASAALISGNGASFAGAGFTIDGTEAASDASGRVTIYDAQGPMKRVSALRIRQDGFAAKHGSLQVQMIVNASPF